MKKLKGKKVKVMYFIVTRVSKVNVTIIPCDRVILNGDTASIFFEGHFVGIISENDIKSVKITFER